MNFRKILSVFLSLSIIFSLLVTPVSAHGAEPIIDTPVVEEPIVEEPIVEEPVVEEPVVEEPVVEEPVVEEPIVEEPVVEEPVVEEPIVEEPIVEEPVVEEPVVEEPVVEEPIVEEPVVEEPIVEDPIVEEPIVEEPIVEEPVVEQPVVEQPVQEQPVEEQPRIRMTSPAPRSLGSIVDLSECYTVTEVEGIQEVYIPSESGYIYIAIPLSAAALEEMADQMDLEDGQAFVEFMAEIANQPIVQVTEENAMELAEAGLAVPIVPTEGDDPLSELDGGYGCVADDYVMIQKIKTNDYKKVDGVYIYTLYGSYFGPVEGYEGGNGGGSVVGAITEIEITVGEVPEFSAGQSTSGFMEGAVSVPADAPYYIWAQKVVDIYGDEVDTFEEGVNYYLEIHLATDVAYFINPQLSSTSTSGLTVDEWHDVDVYVTYPLGQVGGQPGGTAPTNHTHNGDDSWAKDESGHWHVCTADGCTEANGVYGYAAHDFTEGDACVCGAVKEHEHAWAGWNKNKTHHWHECTAADCPVMLSSQKDGYAEHSYNADDICECGAVKSHEHVWATAWTMGEGIHWHECTADGCDIVWNEEKDGYARCVYDGTDVCTICGFAKPTHEHVWNATPNERTKKYHWHGCNEPDCNLNGSKGKDQPLHYGYAPHTFDENGYCEGCNWKITGHTHTWDSEYTYDATSHWYECTDSNCWIGNVEYNDGYAAHRFDLATGKCEDCGYQTVHQHDWMDKWNKTSTHHYRPCSGNPADGTGECFLGNINHQYKAEYAEHTFNTEGYCIVCEWRNTRNPHNHTWATEYTIDGDVHYRDCTDPECNITLVKYNIDYGTHTLDEKGTCVCGYHEHRAVAEYTYDTTDHWKKCAEDDGYRFNVAAHTPNEKGTCVCGHHVHTAVDEYSKNTTEHWFECAEDDGYRFNVAAHTLNEKGTCVCGHHVHTAVDEYSKNTTEHWFECAEGDGYRFNVAAHTLNEKGTCVCGYHVHTAVDEYSKNTTEHWFECAEDDGYRFNVAAHTLDEKGTCVCGYHEHVAVSAYSKNEREHWFECAEDGPECDGTLLNVTAHTLNEKGTCVCGHHEHVAVSAYSKNEREHWFECAENDGHKLEVTAHTLNEKGTCVCGHHEHVAVDAYTFDETHHWNKCAEAASLCPDIQLNKVEHTLGTSGKCTVCGYQAPHEHSWTVYNTTDLLYHWLDCVGPYDVCDVTDVEAMPEYGMHSYDAEGKCICGKTKPDGAVDDKHDVTEDDLHTDGISIPGGVEQYEDEILTADDIYLHETFGLGVDIWLEVSDATGSVSEGDKQLIHAVINNYDGYEIGKYLDIDLWKQVETKAKEPVTDLSGKITIEIELPEELKNTDTGMEREYRVIRLHEGVAEIIPCEYDGITNILSFETDRFSNYTIVYKDSPAEDEAAVYERNFWNQVKDAIEKAENGDTIKVNAGDYSEMPASVMRTLAENDGVIMEINWNGGDTIVIPAGKALSENGRIYYAFSYLEEYDFGEIDWTAQNPATGGYLEITAPVFSDVIPDIKLPTAVKTVVEEAGHNTAAQSAKLNLSWIWMMLAFIVSAEGYLYYDKRKSNNK